MTSPKMQQWIDQKAQSMLDEMDQISFSDDVAEKKRGIIRSGLRDASMELFKRAAERTIRELSDSDELSQVQSSAIKIRKI